jgi:hypothetical protein
MGSTDEKNERRCSDKLSAGLPRFHREFVHPLRVVWHLFAAAETINGQPHGFVQRPRIKFDGVLNTVRIPERYAALLHASTSERTFARKRINHKRCDG